jgi:iduronate 2-sulfatase
MTPAPPQNRPRFLGLFALTALTALAVVTAPSVVAATTTPARPNVLFIAIDDLRNDLGALGVSYARTPQIDAFANTARIFTQHYVQVPTCGASRCALLRGRYPSVAAQVGNNASRDTAVDWAAQSLPAIFKAQGYRTLSLGKITHYPGNLTGKEWAVGPEEVPGVWDRSWIPQGPWKTPEAIMHGYANGVPRDPGKSPPWEAKDVGDDAYPDYWVARDAVTTLRALATTGKPWFFGVGFFKPHLPFAAPKKWHDLHAAGIPDLPTAASAKPDWESGWHASSEFRTNYGHAGRDPATDLEYARLMRRAYAAATSYMDAQLGTVLAALRETGQEENTIVVLWSDHGFLLGEHAIWGKHCLYNPALRSPMMIRTPGLRQPGAASSALVETVDLFPTLADLCGLPAPADLDGRSLRPQLTDPTAPTAKLAHSFWTNGARTVRNDRWRLIVDGDGGRPELFDYQADPLETSNHAAAHPEIVRDLLAQLGRIPEASSASLTMKKKKPSRAN